MTKADIATRIQQELGLTLSESKELLESFLSTMKDVLESGESLKISGFGSFVVKQKKARKGRNPQTCETITLKARRIISFKPSSVLRKNINNEAAAP